MGGARCCSRAVRKLRDVVEDLHDLDVGLSRIPVQRAHNGRALLRPPESCYSLATILLH